MKDKFTPGPWHVVEGDEWTSDIATDTPEQGIWTVASANSRRDEFKANKHLIAAAPELHQAAIDTVDLLNELQAGPLSHCAAVTRAYVQNRIDQLECAIKKATGEL